MERRSFRDRICTLHPTVLWLAAAPRGPRIAGRHRLCVAGSGLVEAKLEAKRSTADFGARCRWIRWIVTTQHRQPPLAQRKVWAVWAAYADRFNLLLQLG